MLGIYRSVTASIPEPFHSLVLRELAEIGVSDPERLEQGFSLRGQLDFETGDMRRSDVDHTFLVAPPSNCWITAHFPENNVDLFNAIISRALKDAVSHAPPCVVGRELRLDAKFAQHYVRKNIGVRVKVNSDTKFRDRRVKNLTHPPLESF